MPFAVTHVILTIILVDLYRDYVTRHKRYFSMHTLFVAGIAGLLPDIDVPLNWLIEWMGFQPGILEHGIITHTAVFGLVFLIPALIFLKKGNKKAAAYFFVIAFGILFHIFLDYLLGGGYYEGVMWLWPLSTATYKVHLLKIIEGPNLLMWLDAAILLLWLWHEEIKHKISDFI
ncbi:hypothetical protein COV19_07660 [Candidatus Woesearchaeota archaeon CG10_big_fil_rev_8_21_14_0_10_44_13]|nr:MAG: hypothetical protein COV19_07660 [Candidatus Woesearchaeota archaeon CG10_big_fil_rev_8_21_14_0_10_44_13]